MNIDDYKKAGVLLLKIQRLDELQECLFKSGKHEKEEQCNVTVNGLSTLIDEKLLSNIINTVADYQKGIEKELEEL